MTNIYTAENVARSRARAAGIRQMVADGRLSADWLVTADEVDVYADERAAAIHTNGSGA